MIKETTILRSKEIDKYLEETKSLLNKQKEVDDALKVLTKNKRTISDELRKLNEWYRKL